MDSQKPIKCLQDKGLNLSGVIHGLRNWFDEHKADPLIQINLSDRSHQILSSWENRPGIKCEGPADAKVVILDSEPHFFKGDAGSLMEKILGAIGLETDSVFIMHAVDFQDVVSRVRKISPKVIVAFGDQAAMLITQNKDPMEQLRGTFHQLDAFKIMPTFHPRSLLEHPEKKRAVWEDMKMVKALLER